MMEENDWARRDLICIFIREWTKMIVLQPNSAAATFLDFSSQSYGLRSEI